MQPEKRKRGAQPGNKNAFKHGFYASAFSKQELKDLSRLESVDLEEEVRLLRLMIRRVVSMSGEMESLDSAVKVLSALGSAASRLAGLLHYQRSLAPEEDLGEAIASALEKMRSELGLDR